MKTLKLIALIALAFTFSHCKSPTQSTQTAQPSLLEVHSILDSAQNKFIDFANHTKGDPFAAIGLTTNWLQSQPTVQAAETLDSVYITILLKSGLRTTFYVDRVDDNGYSIFRGGGGGKSDAQLTLSKHSKNTIKNKKVLLFASDTKSLPGVAFQLPKTIERLTNSGLGFEITTLKNEQCSYGVVEHFGDYGLVIIDGHGLMDGFFVGSTLGIAIPPKTEEDVKTAITTQIDAGAYDKLTSGKLGLVVGLKINTDKPNWEKSVIPTEDRSLIFHSEYLDLLPDMPNSVIFANCCHSGTATNTRLNGTVMASMGTPIRTAFLNRHPISYYCYVRATNGGEKYSFTVTDNFAVAMEDSLVKRLVEDLDSTGDAHRRPNDGAEYYDQEGDSSFIANGGKYHTLLTMKHYGADDYSYEKCGDPIIDVRDGQSYPTVCIGDQTWMAKNLNYDAAGSQCFRDDDANCVVYGKLYNWDVLMQGAASSSSSPSKVKGVCPNGWHLPSEAEWKQAIAMLGGGDIAANAMESDNLWLTPSTSGSNVNSSGFSVLPSGFLTAIDPSPVHADQIWWNKGAASGYWATTEANGTDAINFQFTRNTPFHPVLTQSAFGKSAALPCRCLKD